MGHIAYDMLLDDKMVICLGGNASQMCDRNDLLFVGEVAQALSN
jgi:hypothetical protein